MHLNLYIQIQASIFKKKYAFLSYKTTFALSLRKNWNAVIFEILTRSVEDNLNNDDDSLIEETLSGNLISTENGLDENLILNKSEEMDEDKKSRVKKTKSVSMLKF